MRLDAHQHFWRFDAAQYPWIEPSWPIRRDFLPEDLKALLAQSGLEGSIVVQARQTLVETQWLLDLAASHSVIRGVVGWVDLRSRMVEQDLAQFCVDPRFVGVRHVVQDEPDDRFVLRRDFQRGIAALAQFGLTYDLLIFPRQLPAAIELAKAFPNQPFVLDHLAKPAIKDRVLSPWREQLQELAGCPNVMCKISGMVTEAARKNWQKANFAPYLDSVFSAFGPDRLMFGSDWPVCLLAASYSQVLNLVRDRLKSLSAQEQEAVLGENARRFYLGRTQKTTNAIRDHAFPHP